MVTKQPGHGHPGNGSCCSDFNHCDGRSDGHCNGHEEMDGKKHPCHDFECHMESLNCSCHHEECLSCVEKCESCQYDKSDDICEQPKKTIMQKIR